MWRTPLSLNDVSGSSGVPIEVSRKGKAPPLERGRGKYSPPANPDRVTARALERRDNGVLLSRNMNGFIVNKLQESLVQKSGNSRRALQNMVVLGYRVECGLANDAEAG